MGLITNLIIAAFVTVLLLSLSEEMVGIFLPSGEEVTQNPRSISAKLRVAEKVYV